MWRFFEEVKYIFKVSKSLSFSFTFKYLISSPRNPILSWKMLTPDTREIFFIVFSISPKRFKPIPWIFLLQKCDPALFTIFHEYKAKLPSELVTHPTLYNQWTSLRCVHYFPPTLSHPKRNWEEPYTPRYCGGESTCPNGNWSLVRKVLPETRNKHASMIRKIRYSI